MRAILTWHSVDPSGSPISISPDVFRRQIDWLAGQQVRVVSVSQLLELRDDTSAVGLTFDDGFANFATEAAPLLRDRGLPATLFIVTDHVGRDNRWRGHGDAGIPELRLLDWDELGRLREAGIALGGHTRTHPRLPRLRGAALESELAGAAGEIERRLGVRPDGLAYPYGAVDDEVSRAAAASYRWACTTDLRPIGADEPSFRLPRLDAYYFQAPARLAGWGSAEFRAWLWCHRQGRRLRASIAKPAGA